MNGGSHTILSADMRSIILYTKFRLGRDEQSKGET